MAIRLAVVLGLMTLGIYGGALHTGFVAGDRQFILHNELVGDFGSALSSFAADYWGVLGGESFVYYRPLTVLTHCLDANMWGLAPPGHHLTNLLLHTAVTLLVYALFLRLLPGKTLAAFAGALLFGLHPVHTHSVTYVVGRTDVLATLFFMAGLLVLCRLRCGLKHLTAGAACYLAALLCKEIAVTLPLICFLYCRLQRQERGRTLSVMGALGLALLAYGALRICAVGAGSSAGPPAVVYSLGQRVLLVFETLGFYCVKLLLPVNLCYYSNLVVPGAQMTTAVVMFLGPGVLFLAGCILLRGRGATGFACLWIVVALLPVLNIFQLPVLAKENYLYLPSVGFCLLVATGLSSLRRPAAVRLAVVSLGAVLLLYGVQVQQRNRDYRDPIAYLLSTVRAMRPVAASHTGDGSYFEGVKNWYTTCRNLGRLYSEQQDAARAEYWFTRALDYTPDYFAPKYAADCRVALGRLSLQQGRLDAAEVSLTQARGGTDQPQVVNNLLGVVAGRRGDFAAAEVFFLAALDQQPRYASALFNLSRLYYRQGRRQQAADALQKAAALDPKYRSLPEAAPSPAAAADQ